LSAIPFCKALYHRAILCHEIIVAYQRLNLFPKHLGLIAPEPFLKYAQDRSFGKVLS